MGKLRTTDGFKGLSTHLQTTTTLKVKRRHLVVVVLYSTLVDALAS